MPMKPSPSHLVRRWSGFMKNYIIICINEIYFSLFCCKQWWNLISDYEYEHWALYVEYGALVYTKNLIKNEYTLTVTSKFNGMRPVQDHDPDLLLYIPWISMHYEWYSHLLCIPNERANKENWIMCIKLADAKNKMWTDQELKIQNGKTNRMHCCMLCTRCI